LPPPCENRDLDSVGSQSARRALSILLAFTPQRNTLSAKSLSKLTGIPLTSVFRYISLLTELNLVVGDDQGRYHLSTRFAALAQAYESAEAQSPLSLTSADSSHPPALDSR
jgi:DNA-binding IclR family transcriptional regulator